MLYAMGRMRQMSARALEAKTPIRMAHGRLPDITRKDPPFWRERSSIRRPMSARFKRRGLSWMRVPAWPSPGTVNIHSDVYFEVSALIEGRKYINLPSATLRAASRQSTFPPPVPPPPDTVTPCMQRPTLQRRRLRTTRQIPSCTPETARPFCRELEEPGAVCGGEGA
jgi:hypothetical protein